MALGLVGARGVTALQEGLRRRLIERAMAERQAQELELQKHRLGLEMRSADRADRALDQTSEQNRLTRESLEEQRAATAADRDLTQNRALDELTPAGFLPPTSPIAGRLVKIGAAVPVDERPRVDEGPLLPGDTGAAQAAGFEKRETAAQRNVRLDNERAAAQAEAQAAVARATAAHQGLVDTETARHNRAVEGSTAETRSLAGELQQLKIQAERDKQEAAKTTKEQAAQGAQDVTKGALDLINRLETHPGMGAATGAYEVRGFTQGARDFNSIRNQVVAALTLPNLGALKGPMSDKDIMFVKQLATRLADTNISEEETRRAITEAKQFLENKLKSQGGSAGGGGGGAGGPRRVVYDMNGNPVK